MSNRSYRMMPVGELFAHAGFPRPRTYAAWPVWHDSTPADGPEVTKRLDLTHKRTNHELRRPRERHRARP
jgi:hypothetical protein